MSAPKDLRRTPPARDQIPDTLEEAVERCSVYDGDGKLVEGDFSHDEALAHVRSTGSGWVWLGLLEPSQDQMMDIARAYDVHELIAEDAVTAHQRPKVERYDNQLFFVVRSISYRDHETVHDTKEIIETGEVQMIIGPDFIITIRHGKPSTIRAIRQVMKNAPEQCLLGPPVIAWMIADNLVDEYLRIAAELQSDVDELEDDVFDPEQAFAIEQIYTLKREILEMRHSIDPLAQAMRSLIESHRDIFSKPLRSYFRDVLDHELIAVDMVASLDERLTALIDAGVAMISIQQNEDMRKISALVGMVAPPTMIAGIYGMNFENMPELATHYGYFITLAVMAVCVLTMYVFMRRAKWL
ncbi:magnesium/cobalt transporter CorA [Corynebacterium mendelii]|uniref:magnesium/cobalt transporter CorA n=1 Tax=Corynebacterium mendelii TaxID=2765362 RepID=UPI002ED2D8F9